MSMAEGILYKDNESKKKTDTLSTGKSAGKATGAAFRRILRRNAPGFAAVVSILAVWHFASLFMPAFLLPRLPAVIERGRTLIASGDYFTHLAGSFSRLAAGYSIALFLGIIAGLAGGVSLRIRNYLRALISIMQSIPPITWVPLLVILVGFGDIPIIIAVTISSLYPVILNIMNSAAGVSEKRITVAKLFGAGKLRLITSVYIPEILPGILSGAQIAFGNAWRSMVAAEMVSGTSSGLGWAISYSSEIADMSGVLLYMISIGVIAVTVDRILFRGIADRYLHKKREN